MDYLKIFGDTDKPFAQYRGEFWMVDMVDEHGVASIWRDGKNLLVSDALLDYDREKLEQALAAYEDVDGSEDVPDFDTDKPVAKYGGRHWVVENVDVRGVASLWSNGDHVEVNDSELEYVRFGG